MQKHIYLKHLKQYYFMKVCEFINNNIKFEIVKQ